MSYVVTEDGTDGIRRGPGKFSTELDALLYSASLDGGPDEQCGESDTGGWYGLMRKPGQRIGQACEESYKRALTPDERRLLIASPAAIIAEDSNGFVYVTWYETEAEAMSDWADLEGFANELEWYGDGAPTTPSLREREEEVFEHLRAALAKLEGGEG